MRVFVTKEFRRFAQKQKLGDDRLCGAVERAEDGLIDANLRGGVIKQRVARAGEGRSSGFRTLIAYRRGQRAVFVNGFAKNERANIDEKDLKALKKIAAVYLSAAEQKIGSLLAIGELQEVVCNDEE